MNMLTVRNTAKPNEWIFIHSKNEKVILQTLFDGSSEATHWNFPRKKEKFWNIVIASSLKLWHGKAFY